MTVVHVKVATTQKRLQILFVEEIQSRNKTKKPFPGTEPGKGAKQRSCRLLSPLLEQDHLSRRLLRFYAQHAEIDTAGELPPVVTRTVPHGLRGAR